MSKRTWTSRAGALSLALATVGALVWSGCSSDSSSGGSYYCDETGCFQCDGYSCSSVSPPQPKACTGSSGCPSGYECTTAGCEPTCSTSADCPQGAVCKDGLCVAPGTNPPPPLGCTTNADCPAGDACVASSCVAQPGQDAGADAPSAPDTGVDSGPTCGVTEPCGCSANADCATGQVCVAGVCTAASNACKFSSECPAGDVCADGQCVPDCSTVTCPTGSTCTKGACIPTSTGANCSSDAQCSAAAPRCVGGHCTAACTADAQCPKGDYCNQGACVPDTRPTPGCKTGTDCMATQQCVTGYCRYSCSSNDQCAHIDARIPVCGPSNVCWSADEANPQCTSKSDCPAGQDCIGNVCR